MRTICLVLAVASCSALTAEASPDAYIDSLCQVNNVAGLSACAFYGDSLVWSGVYGVRNFSYEDSLVNESTLFYLWSVSKPITAIAFMQLWEDGLVELDADVNDYLPYSIRNPNHPDDPITPRMILTHTSSLKTNSAIIDAELAAGDTTYSNTEYAYAMYVPEGIWYDPMVNFYGYQPGTQYNYNTKQSQAVLAAIVEQVSTVSDSFELHCRDCLFNPLGMDLTSYLIGNVDTLYTAVPYAYSGGEWTAPFGYGSAPWYAGGLLKSNPLELADPLIAVMQGGQIGGVRILQEATVDTMLTVQNPSLNPDWGLGWRRLETGGRVLWGHYGNVPALGNYLGKAAMYFCPAEGSAVVFASNGCVDNVCVSIMNMLFDYVADEVGMVPQPGPQLLSLTVAPNPFPAVATVQFALPESGPVSLYVYDLSGRLTDTIEDSWLPAGEHEAVLDGSGLPSGVYLVRLDTIYGAQTLRCLRI